MGLVHVTKMSKKFYPVNLSGRAYLRGSGDGQNKILKWTVFNDTIQLTSCRQQRNQPLDVYVGGVS